MPVLPSTCPHRRRRWMSSTDRQLQENGRTVTRSYWLFLKQGQINLKQGLIHLKPDNLSLALWTMDIVQSSLVTFSPVSSVDIPVVVTLTMVTTDCVSQCIPSPVKLWLHCGCCSVHMILYLATRW